MTVSCARTWSPGHEERLGVRERTRTGWRTDRSTAAANSRSGRRPRPRVASASPRISAWVKSSARIALLTIATASSHGRLRMQSTSVRTCEVTAPSTSSGPSSHQCGTRIVAEPPVHAPSPREGDLGQRWWRPSAPSPSTAPRCDATARRRRVRRTQCGSGRGQGVAATGVALEYAGPQRGVDLGRPTADRRGWPGRTRRRARLPD